MKILYISNDFLAPDLALRIKNEGHDIAVALKEEGIDVLKGTLRRIPFEKRLEYAKSCDLVIYDDKMDGEPAELRSMGISVIGGGKLTDEIELDRIKASKLAEACGINAPKVHKIKDLPDAKKFIEERGGKWVLKQMGKLDSIKGLNGVASMDNSEDLIAKIDKLIEVWPKGLKQEFILQEKVEGHEFACLDKETEILTDQGWKRFYDLNKSEKVATLNAETKEIEYQKPERYIKRYDADIYTLSHRKSLDFAVTHDHNMAIISHNDLTYHKDEKIQLKPLKDIKYQSFIKKDGIWVGKNSNHFILPSLEILSGWRGKEKVEEKKIPMTTWLRFLGWVLSDGCTNAKNGSWVTCITQSFVNSEKRKDIESVLSSMPFSFDKNGVNFRISSKQLYLYVSALGKGENKHIPDFIGELSPELIRVFLDSFMLGDGTVHKGTKYYFPGISKIMADQLQELVFKAGGYAIVKIVNSKPHELNGRMITSRRDNHIVVEYKEKYSTLFPDKIVKKEYNDFTYCVTVPNHIIYVRRNGKPMWIGNCGSYWNGKEFQKDDDGDEICEENWEHKPLMAGNMGEATGEQFTVMHYLKAKNSKLFSETLDKIRPLLKKIDFRGDIDINCIVNEKGAHFLEFTPRMGVPATSAQIAIQETPWGEFFKAIADGKQVDGYKYNQGYCIVSWLYTKPFPAMNSKKVQAMAEKLFEGKNSEGDIAELMSYKLSDSYGMPVLFKEKLSEQELKNLHFDAVFMDKGQLKISNSDGYVLTVTGMGQTVDEAAEKVESLLKKIKISGGFWRNDFKKSNYHSSRNDLIEWGYLDEEKDEDELETIKKQIKEVLKK